MPQIQLPIFPVSSTAITSELAFEQRDGQVYYFNGHLPVFTHPVDDIASFRFFTSQLIAYPSETALVHLARVTLRRSDDARSFVRGLLQTPIIALPEVEAKRWVGGRGDGHTMQSAKLEPIAPIERTAQNFNPIAGGGHVVADGPDLGDSFCETKFRVVGE